MTIREISGERYVYQRTIESEEICHFVSGGRIAVARMSVGYGPVSTPWELNSRALNRDNTIPSIATNETVMRDQYFEHEARWLAPWGSEWLPQDYDLDGDFDVNLSPFSPPQVFDGEGAANAWTIRAGRFRYTGDADAKLIGLALFIREMDVPIFKAYPDGFGTIDIIGHEPTPLQRAWRWISEEIL